MVIEPRTAQLAPHRQAESPAPLDKLRLICESLDESKAQNLVVLDVRTLTLLADYFVVCSGTSSVHLQAIAESLLERGKEQGYRGRLEGDARSYWLVLDYGEVIVHVFSPELREFYDLEGLWSGAIVIRWSPGALS